MIKLAKRGVRAVLRRAGYDVIPRPLTPYPPDFDEKDIELCEFVKPFTGSTPERVFALRQAVKYVVRRSIPGAIVECGVYRGGSMMAVARTLLELGVTDRKLFLYDTYEGMSEPTSADVNYLGDSAAELLRRATDKQNSGIWCYGALEDVKRNLFSTGYPQSNMFFIKGKVEDTLPDQAPDTISLLRLDTDWYESTYHELVHLYPRLGSGGVLLLDDYGYWAGARKAVDSYIAEHNLHLLLDRIDYTGRICTKPGN